MALTPAPFEGRRVPIDAYGDGGFRLAGVFRAGSLLLLPYGAEPWAVADPEGLEDAPLGAILAQAREIELLLVGTGTELRPLPKAMAEILKAQGIRYETMATGAAARTFNVLLAEDRHVAVALIAVP